MLLLIIVKSTIINRILEQMQLWCRSSADTKFHSTGRHYEKNFTPKTSSYRACSEINVIQPKCWRDKRNVELFFYELSVFTNDFSISLTRRRKAMRAWMSWPWKKSAAFNAKINNFSLLKDYPDNLKAVDLMLKLYLK